MPICRECERVAASAELRRTKDGQWLCKDKIPCKVRAKEKTDVGKLVKSVPSSWKEL